MRHRVKKLPKLSRSKGHVKALVRNLVTSLILHERIKTTETKAKAIQPIVEKLISDAKKKEERLAIKALQKVLFEEEASKKMMTDLKKRFAKKDSGFTRITSIGNRSGDMAPLVQIELIP